MGYYCGIDAGSKSCFVTLMNNQRQVVKKCKLPTTDTAFSEFFSQHRNLKCLVEACPLAEWICNHVESHGHHIDIVCARIAQARMCLKGKKTDERDSYGLAELAFSGWYEAVHKKSKEARATRGFLKARKQLVESSNSIASSIRGILRTYGIKLTVGSDSARFSEQVSQITQEQQLPESICIAIKELLESFTILRSKQKSMLKQLKAVAKACPITQQLQTTPGVGVLTASTFVATIDDPHRFSNGEKLASYLGLVPRVYQSGATEYYGRITKSGDCLLRWLLVEAASALLTRSHSECALRQWGLSLREKKGTGKALVAVARKLCGILLAMWKSGEPFHAQPTTM